MGKIIGIDLGTTNSVVAIMEGKEPKVIANEEGSRLTPSVVAFDEKGEVLVGHIARRQAITKPENTVFSSKRFIGRKFADAHSQEEAKRVPFKGVAAANGDAAFEIRGKRYSPPEIGARVLMKLKRAAEEYLGEPVTEAVITVPANFNDSQRQATKAAGKIAGLEVKRIINAPTAAALAFGLDQKEGARKSKIELSSSQQTEVNLPYITADQSGPKHLSMKITRAKFESLVEDLIDRTVEPCRPAIKDAGVSLSVIGDVILVGGQTRMPKVQDVVKQIFGKDPRKDVNPDEAVAVGAAIQASVLAGERKDVLLLDVTPLSLGIETLGGVMTKLIQKNTTIPTEATQTFSTADDNQTAVTIHVVQGERDRAADNKARGGGGRAGGPPAPRGGPQGEVSFDIDANGILNVSAKDKATGKEQKIVTKASSGLNEDEIKRMVRDAEAHAADDKKFRELVETRNKADGLIHSVEKTVKDLGDKVDAGERAKVESAISDLRTALKSDDMNVIEKKTEALAQASAGIAQKAYAANPGAGPEGAAGPAGGAGAAGSAGASGAEGRGDVVVAEFEEVKVKDSK